jgi:hypothetical protein
MGIDKTGNQNTRVDFERSGVVPVSGFNGEDLAVVVGDDYTVIEGWGRNGENLVGREFTHLGNFLEALYF